MDSLGLSPGNILLVSNYAYTVHNSCKYAGDAFKSISLEVNSLRAHLLLLKDDCASPQTVERLRASQREEIEAHMQRCKADLREVKKMLRSYRLLHTGDMRYHDQLAFITGRQDPRYRDQMAFITSRRAELRFKITTNSARLRQFLLGMGVKSISNIEGKIEAVSSQLPLLKPGLETHFLSRQGLRKKLEEIRADILTGRRDLPAADSVDSAVDIEDEVLGDNLTDVDLWYEVHAWMDTLPSNASAKTQQREDLTNPPQQEHNNRSIIDTRYLKRVPAPNIDTTYHLNPPTKTWLPVSQVPAPPSPSTETIIPSTVPLPVPPEELHTNPTLHLTTKRGRTPRPKNRPPFPSANTSS